MTARAVRGVLALSLVLGASTVPPAAAAQPPRPPTVAAATTAQPPPTVGPAAAQPPPPSTAPPAGREPPPTGSAVPPPGGSPVATPGLRLPDVCAPPPPDDAVPPAASPADRWRLTEAHLLATGTGQTVAVIDTGVAPHPRLADRLRGAGDYLTGGDGLDDCDGHGTAVAGLIAATADPGDELVGVAPDARLIALRQSSAVATVTGPDGTATGAGELDTLAEAIVRATDEGAGVVNVSEVACVPPEVATDAGAPIRAALAHAAAADVVVVAAAGNTGVAGCPDDPTSGTAQETWVALPGWYDGVLTVGAVDPFDAAAPFTVPGAWVDVAAPGTDLRSLAVGGGVTGSGTTGTSFAAPLVAGLAALVRERFPELTAAQVVDRIVATARRPATGHDPRTGFGVVDPLQALTALPAVLPPPSPPATSPVGEARPAEGAELLAGRPADPPPAPVPPVELAAIALLGAAALALLALRRVRR